MHGGHIVMWKLWSKNHDFDHEIVNSIYESNKGMKISKVIDILRSSPSTSLATVLKLMQTNCQMLQKAGIFHLDDYVTFWYGIFKLSSFFVMQWKFSFLRVAIRVSQKSRTLDFQYFDIWKYSISWFHQIKHCLLKRMIPRSFDFIR